MKKIVAILVFFYLCHATSFAQAEFRFGINAGVLNLTWLGSDDNQINPNGQNLGFKVGMTGELYFRENYALVSGLGLAFNQGGTLRHDFGGNFFPQSELSNPDFNTGDDALPNDVELKYGIQYIEIPIGFKMRTTELGELRYFAELPIFTIGILSQARGSITGEGVALEDENIKPDIIPINLSWGLGGGAEYYISEKTTILAGIYFQQGIFDINENKERVTYVDSTNIKSEDSKAKVNSITLRIGVMF